MTVRSSTLVRLSKITPIGMKLAKQFPPQFEGGNLPLIPLEGNHETVVFRPGQLATDAPRARMLGPHRREQEGRGKSGARAWRPCRASAVTSPLPRRSAQF